MKKKDLSVFKEPDIYSLSMFVLYKLTATAEYSTLSELAYTLDKENMLKLCEYFGGLTIRIPTLEELKTITSLLLLYQYINFEGMSYEEAIKQLESSLEDNKKTRLLYAKVSSILNEYDIKTL